MMPTVYVPILKAKEGELAALQELSSDLRGFVTPLLEVPPVPFDFINERRSKSLKDHVAGLGDRIVKCWGGRRVFIDASASLALPSMPQANPLDDVVDNCLAAAVKAVPVVSLDDTAARLQSAKRCHSEVGEGYCVRLSVSGPETDFEKVDQLVTNLLNRLSAEPAQIDLIIDLQDIRDDIGRNTLVASALLSLVKRWPWRMTALAAASFPEDLSDVDASTAATMPRAEWLLWKRIAARSSGRTLVFSDYGISHPVQKELDPRTMRMSASIRYTTDDAWLVLKGRNVRQYGFEQYFELSRDLTKRAEYKGEEFSWGDGYIAACAAKDKGPGNATTWRKVGTNHHLTLVARQLANLADGA